MATYADRALISDYTMTKVQVNNIPYQNGQGTEAQRTLYTVPSGKVLIPHGVRQWQVNASDYFASALSIDFFGSSLADSQSDEYSYLTNTYTDLLNFDKSLTALSTSSSNQLAWEGDKIIHNAPQIGGGNQEDYNIIIWFWLADVNNDIIRN